MQTPVRLLVVKAVYRGFADDPIPSRSAKAEVQD
jgi:hypothetical protein